MQEKSPTRYHTGFSPLQTPTLTQSSNIQAYSVEPDAAHLVVFFLYFSGGPCACSLPPSTNLTGRFLLSRLAIAARHYNPIKSSLFYFSQMGQALLRLLLFFLYFLGGPCAQEKSPNVIYACILQLQVAALAQSGSLYIHPVRQAVAHLLLFFLFFQSPRCVCKAPPNNSCLIALRAAHCVGTSGHSYRL